MMAFDKLSKDAAVMAEHLSLTQLREKPKGHVLMDEAYVLPKDEAQQIMHYLVEASRVFHLLQLEAEDHRRGE